MYEAFCDIATLKFHFIKLIILKNEKNNHVKDLISLF